MVLNKKTIFYLILGLAIVLVGFKYLWDTKMDKAKNDCVNRGGIWNSEAKVCDTIVSKELLSDTFVQMYVGIVSKPEATSYQYGTHVLTGHILDGNPQSALHTRNYALKSSKLNIDKFIGKKVICIARKIQGYPVDFGPEFLEIEHIEEDKPISITSGKSK